MSVLPQISCVMPTRDCRRFVSQAIWYFLRQDYPQRELIVVDDGADPVRDLIPGDASIHYIHSPRPLTLGAKYNLGCSLSSGEIIANWDDDTWYSPYRLSAQVAQLAESGAETAALSGLLHYQPLTGRVWRYDPERAARTAVHPGSLAYRRSCWNSHPFSETTRDSASEFVRCVPTDQLHVQDGAGIAVAVLHGSNTGRVNPADPCWQPRSFDEVGRVLEPDLRFYTGLHTNGDLAARRHAPVGITLAATFMVYDGFGSMAEYLALGMARAGADVQIAPFRMDPAAMSPEFLELWRRSRPDPDGVVLCHAWWGENLSRFGSARDLFVKTVWETNRLPADWPGRLNKATAVIVPSDFAARVFRESGVGVPVEVAYEGVDPEVYPYQERPERGGLTTLVVGVLSPRKNFRQAVAAWKLAFADAPDARLILKARFQLEPYVPDDPRIRVVDSNESTRGILHWYAQADVLLALGNEGFGLPLIEGMATGLPVVALNSEAQADVCAEAVGMVLPVRPGSWEKVDVAPYGPCGERALPDVEDAARQLRWVAEHRSEARQMGRHASAWAHARRNVWNMGPATLEAIERHTRLPRPLRQAYAVWAPAGLATPAAGYYVQDLVRSLSLVRLYDAPPAAWRSQALHIQLAPGLFDEATLAQGIHAAQRDGIPVAVTEHAVGEHAEAWELRADVLVALSAADATRLRGRWPRKRVEVIPPACLPWRAATRAGAVQTIAVIGWPGSGLDAWAPLAAERTLCGARLLIFCPPLDIDGEHRCEAVLGLPAQFVNLPRTSEELACQLNEEADVVVFWGRNAGHWATSYVARIALASGVPVLTSPTSEYADLATATFQPVDLVAGLREVSVNRARRVELASAAHVFCQEASWPRVAALHLALWHTLSS